MTETLPTVPAVCVYADQTGQSHLIDVQLPALAQVRGEDGGTRFLGANGATTMGFVVGGSTAMKDWHPSGIVGLSIVLRGAWEIEAGSGQRRRLDTGSVLLMFDTHGQGHRSHSCDEAGSTVLGVGLDEATREAYWTLVQQAI